MAMHTELVSIPTDTVPLDGAWYRPEGGAAMGATDFSRASGTYHAVRTRR